MAANAGVRRFADFLRGRDWVKMIAELTTDLTAMKVIPEMRDNKPLAGACRSTRHEYSIAGAGGAGGRFRARSSDKLNAIRRQIRRRVPSRGSFEGAIATALLILMTAAGTAAEAP
ncbi:MAG: hypothetical protein JJ992_27295, partial [Planctomycetes bacterium]|nr:hypothetical protein [Planctomycetota bacterium]